MFKRMMIKAMCHIILNSVKCIAGYSYSCIICIYGKLAKFKLVNLYKGMLTTSYAESKRISKSYNVSIITLSVNIIKYVFILQTVLTCFI